MEEQFPEIVETQPELLAQHYSGAGLTEQAIVYWEKAGERAIQGSANAEAIERLSKALELLATVPETPERIRRELALQTRLGPAVQAVKGFAAPEVETVYNRARELCARVADCPQLLFSTLRGLWALSPCLERGMMRRTSWQAKCSLWPGANEATRSIWKPASRSG